MDESKKISLASAVLMSMNIMIGAGIFFGPQIMASHAGSMSFLGWLFVAVLVSPIILSVATASRIFPGDGGFYNYSKSALGEAAGFMSIWACFIGYLGSAGVQITVIRELFQNDLKIGFAQHYPLAFAALVIAIVFLLNLLPINVISRIQSSMTLIKLFPLFFVIGLLAKFFNPSFQYHLVDISGLGYTIPVCIFAYNGWEACCSLGHMIKGGSKNVPFVLFTAFGIVATMYTLFHISIMYIMGVENLVKLGAIAFPQFLGVQPSTAALIQGAIIYSFLLSYSNALYGISVANISNLQVLAEKRYLIGSSFWSKLSSNERPARIVFLYALALFTLGFVINSKTALLVCTGFGISSTFLLTIFSTLVAQIRSHSIFGVLQAVAAILSCSVLFYFNWAIAGTTAMERLVNIAPIIILALFGYFMFMMLSPKSSSRS